MAALAVFASACGGSGSVGCVDALRFQDRPYVGYEAAEVGDVQPGAGAGVATTLPCGDTGDTPEDGVRAESVQVSRVDGIDLEVALMSDEQSDVLYVAAGRCLDAADLGACLRRRLELRGERYTRSRVHEDHGPPPEQAGSPFFARLRTPAGTERVAVRGIRGVPIADAVSAQADSRDIYVADGRCYVSTTQNLVSCLRAGG
jgi:Family of unknown function (DUF6281)